MTDVPVMLLGAGASAEAGIPTAFQMPTRITELVASQEQPIYQRALDLVIGGAQMGPSTPYELGRSRNRSVDIERLLNAAILLGDRFNSELSPFVGTWHPLVAELELQDRRIDLHRVSSAINRLEQRNRSRYSSDNVGWEVARELEEAFSEAALGPDGSLYRNLSQIITAKLLQLAWVTDSSRVQYLKPLIELAESEGLCVATLNYDNTIEVCAKEFGIECDTGLSSWQESGSIPDMEVGIRLLKLHGSADWMWEHESRLHYDPFSFRSLRQMQDGEMKELVRKAPLIVSENVGRRMGVIFGGRNKLTAEGPFLDLLLKFKRSLSLSNHLVSVGYSFRDPHINAAIIEWLRAKRTSARVTLIDAPGAEPSENTFWAKYKAELRDKLEFEPLGAGAGLAKLFR